MSSRLFIILSFLTTTQLHAGLDSEIAALMAQMKCPGAATIVVQKPSEGESRHAPVIRYYGLADLETNEPLGAHHAFRLGSTTKLYVGYLARVLEQNGSLALSRTVADYIPGAPLSPSHTFEDLGRHRTGLVSSIRNAEFREKVIAEPAKYWTAPEILPYAFAQKASDEWAYANVNTILLGEAISAALSESLPQLMATHVFDLHALSETRFETDAEALSNLASGYRHASEEHPIGYGKTFLNVSEYNSSIFSWAGNLISTAPDVAKALPFLLGDASPLPTQAAPWVESYGESEYAFCLERWDGFIGHRGDVPGFQAVLARDLETGTYYAVLCNLSNAKDGRMPANEILRLMRKKG